MKTINILKTYKLTYHYLLSQVKAERSNVLMDEKHVVRAGFVSFNSCWAAAVCAQTQQSRDHTKWVTEWAPEPRDVYWKGLTLERKFWLLEKFGSYMQLNFYRLTVNIIVVALIICYFVPVAFVQSLANLDTLIKYFPFLKPMIHWSVPLHQCYFLIIDYSLNAYAPKRGHIISMGIERNHLSAFK